MKRLKENSRAAGPAISTVILTGVMVALISVALVFVNSSLWTNVAASDFSSGEQFMQTIGLQIDNVAWTVGRKATVQYSSTCGAVSLLPSALNYTIYVKTQGSGTYKFFVSNTTGVLLFNIPTSKYSVSNGYYQLLYPPSAKNLTFTGTSAPVARVFCVEKLTPPMSDGSFVRVVVAPSIRSLFSNMTTTGASTYYVRLYLPVLVLGSVGGSSKSVTLTGSLVSAYTQNQITSINVTARFPQQGFDASSFFHFSTTTQIINVPAGYSNSVLELYTGRVTVQLGV